MAETESAVAANIVLALFVGMVIIYVTARIIGPEKKEKWFRKRQRMNFFNRRGFVGNTWHFGYPRTREGLAVALLMYGVIGLVGYEIIFGSLF